MWGWNEKGQLGLGVNHDHDNGQSSSGQVQCQAVPVPINFPDDLEVMTVSCGTRHTAAVTGMQTVIIPLSRLWGMEPCDNNEENTDTV